MEVVTYQAIQGMNPWNYEEHQVSATINSTASDVANAYGIAVDSSSNVYVAYSGEVRKLDSSGTQVWAKTDVANARGIAVDSSSNVYVAYLNAVGTTTVRKLDSSGTQVWAKTDVANAWGIAVDSSSNVYVAYLNAVGTTTVRKLDSSGTEILAPFTDILNISGKGFIDYCLNYHINLSSFRLKIIKDGATILDENNNTAQSKYPFFGIMPSSSLNYVIDNSGYKYIYSSDEGMAQYLYDSNSSSYNTILNPSFPSASEQSVYGCALAIIHQPIYFNQSLQIQVQSINAVLCKAKVRY